MYFEEARKDLEQMFKTGWASTSRVKYENTQLTPVPGDDETWVAMTIREGKGVQASLGNNPLLRFKGFVVIQVFSPKDSGTSKSKQLQGMVGKIFDRKFFMSSHEAGYFKFEIAYPIEPGVREGWYQVNVMVPFTRDVTIVSP